LRLSPNGTLVANPDARHGSVTNIFLNGALDAFRIVDSDSIYDVDENVSESF